MLVVCSQSLGIYTINFSFDSSVQKIVNFMKINFFLFRSQQFEKIMSKEDIEVSETEHGFSMNSMNAQIGKWYTRNMLYV